jgi:hypothetical protein
MAREAGGREVDKDDPQCCIGSMAFDEHELKAFEALVRADEREQALAAQPAPTVQQKPWSKQWTEAQHERAYRNSPELHKDVKSLAAFKRVAKSIAAMYGITKGQP